MSEDKYEEMAREIIVGWFAMGISHTDALTADVASALRQVERETLERAERTIRELRESHQHDTGECDTRIDCDYVAAWETAEGAIRALSANELSITQELADVSTPVKLIDRDQSDGYVPLSLMVAATRLHEAARPDDGPNGDAIIPARVFREFVDAHAEALMNKRAGWVLVPPEPTEKMLQAALDSCDDGMPAPAYRAMIQVAEKGE